MQQNRNQNAKVPQEKKPMQSQAQPSQQRPAVQHGPQKMQMQQRPQMPQMTQAQPRPQPQKQPSQQRPVVQQIQQNTQRQQMPQMTKVQPRPEPQQRPQMQPMPQPQSKQLPQARPQQSQPRPQQAQLGVTENVVFVGQKPSMAYVLAVMTQFNSGSVEVRVKARGKSIARAVDVAEIIRRKFLKDMRVKSIRIDTEEFQPEGGSSKVPVSTIELVLCR